MTQDHQETPRTAAHELHAHLTACSGGLSPDYTCAIPVHVCEPETARQVTELRAALQPFAAFADPRHVVPDGFVITQGSSMARRQLTMGDCYAAAALLSAGDKAEAPLTAERNARND